MRNLVFVLTLAVVMLVSSPAMAALTLAANWNGGDPPVDAPGTWKDVDFSYMDRQTPPDPVVNDYLLHNSAWWTLPALTPTGKFGSGLDATQDPGDPFKATGGYLIMNYELEGQLMFDAAGTVTWWFKPNWDSTTDTEVRHIVSSQQYYPAAYNDHRVDVIADVAGGTSRLEFTNMDGSVTTSVPYDVTKILTDWNHMAVCWDVDGTRLYMNGNLEATSPEKMAVAEAPVVENQYFFIGGRQAPPASVDMYGADGIFDDFGVYTTALYTGASYTIPGEIDVGTLFGDLDGDGFVGQTDLDIVLAVWGQSVPPADARADPTGDGFVGQGDLDTVLGDWGKGTPPTPAVPEPATLSMLGLGALALIRRRRK